MQPRVSARHDVSALSLFLTLPAPSNWFPKVVRPPAPPWNRDRLSGGCWRLFLIVAVQVVFIWSSIFIFDQIPSWKTTALLLFVKVIQGQDSVLAFPASAGNLLPLSFRSVTSSATDRFLYQILGFIMGAICLPPLEAVRH